MVERYLTSMDIFSDRSLCLQHAQVRKFIDSLPRLLAMYIGIIRDSSDLIYPTSAAQSSASTHTKTPFLSARISPVGRTRRVLLK